MGAHGYRLVEAATAREGQLLASNHPALVLLDLGLPDADGPDVVTEVRGFSRVPIVVLSARGQEDDKVRALDAGADDYLTKPFGVNELLARIRVALRHGAAGPQEEPVLEVGELRLDRARHEVRRGEEELHLTPTEFKLLLLLMENAGRVLTHRQILEKVWGPAYTSQTHYVRVHLAELRKKVERDPARPRWIVTEPGVGYRLRDER